MRNKVKLLMAGSNKKSKSFMASLEAMIERQYAPDMYDFLTTIGESETMKQLAAFQPEIVLLFNGDGKATLGLLKAIKQQLPLTPVLIPLSIGDDEQAVTDALMACGAYKCYPQPMLIDTVVHDMFVALNLE